MSSPLGRYSDVAATIAALVVLAAWVGIHSALSLSVVHGGDTTALDAAGTLVLGVLLGQRATTNGAAKVADAANKRLDAIGAPALAAIPPAAGAGSSSSPA